MPPERTVIIEPAHLEAIEQEIAARGRFCFDLEFASEARFTPELSLFQLSWGDPNAPQTAVIDCLQVDPSSLFRLISSPEIETVAHAAAQDVALLAARFGVRPRSFWDTQIAAAFVGLGDQIGYAKLVEKLLGITLDKGVQYTAWLKRPLSARQLEYAEADVLHLPRLWEILRTKLEERGRLAWVGEESSALGERAASAVPDEQAYREVNGWRSLDPRALGCLKALARWRQRVARQINTPLSWLLPDRAMIELCRRPPKTARDLGRIRGIYRETVRRWGADILAELEKGIAEPLVAETPAKSPSLTNAGQTRAKMAVCLIQALCSEAEIAPRFVGTRADAESLVRWFERGARRGEEQQIALLRGWRRELVGQALVSWLRGDLAIVSDRGSASGLRLAHVEGEKKSGSRLSLRRDEGE